MHKGTNSIKRTDAGARVRGGRCMNVLDEENEQVVVSRDPGRSIVVLTLGADGAEDARTVRLTRVEARRLAALLLFQAARLERPLERWRLPEGARQAEPVMIIGGAADPHSLVKK